MSIQFIRNSSPFALLYSKPQFDVELTCIILDWDVNIDICNGHLLLINKCFLLCLMLFVFHNPCGEKVLLYAVRKNIKLKKCLSCCVHWICPFKSINCFLFQVTLSTSFTATCLTSNNLASEPLTAEGVKRCLLKAFGCVCSWDFT